MVHRRCDALPPSLRCRLPDEEGNRVSFECRSSIARPYLAISEEQRFRARFDVIQNLLPRSMRGDRGGMAFTFFPARRDEIGDLAGEEEEKLDLAKSLLEEMKTTATRDSSFPSIALIADRLRTIATAKWSLWKIPQGWRGLDIGPEDREGHQIWKCARPRRSLKRSHGCF